MLEAVEHRQARRSSVGECVVVGRAFQHRRPSRECDEGKVREPAGPAVQGQTVVLLRSLLGFLRWLVESAETGNAGRVLLTNPVTQSDDLLESFEIRIKAVGGDELLQLHHNLQLLAVSLNVQKHQLGAS